MSVHRTYLNSASTELVLPCSTVYFCRLLEVFMHVCIPYRILPQNVKMFLCGFVLLENSGCPVSGNSGFILFKERWWSPQHSQRNCVFCRLCNPTNMIVQCSFLPQPQHFISSLTLVKQLKKCNQAALSSEIRGKISWLVNSLTYQTFRCVLWFDPWYQFVEHNNQKKGPV